MRKKGVFFSVVLLVITLISLTTLAVVLMNQHADVERAIGERQVDLMRASERAERALNYLDTAVSLSANKAIHNISARGGFTEETDCGEYREVNMWNCEENETYGSFPMLSDVEDSFVNYIEPMLDNYLANYKYEFFPLNNYIYSISKEGAIKGEALRPMVIHNKSFEVSMTAEPYQDFNWIIWEWQRGEGGDRFSDLAEDFARRYSDLPYVLGGISPYPYSVTKEEKEEGNPVFHGVYIPETYPAGSDRAGQSIQPGFDCSGFVWWTLRHMSIEVNRKTAHDFYHWAEREGDVVCDSNNYNDCWSSREKIEDNAEPGDLFFIDPCENNPGREVCHIAIYAGDGKIVDSSGARNGLAVRELPNGYLPGNEWETVAIYRPDFYELDTFEMEDKMETDESEEQVIEEQPDFSYDSPEKESGFEYSIKPSFSIDTDYNLSVYNELRSQSLNFIEEVQGCDKRVEDCVDSRLNEIGGQDFNWSRNCTDKETMFRYRFEDTLRSCFESDCESCYCNLTLPENEIFEGLEYEFFILSDLSAEEIVLPFEKEEENEETQLTEEQGLSFAYFDEEGQLKFDESQAYPFKADYNDAGDGSIEQLENGNNFFLSIWEGFIDLIGLGDDSIKNIYFIKKDGKIALIGEEDLGELISKKEGKSEEESGDESEDEFEEEPDNDNNEEFPECTYSEKRKYRFCVSTDEITPAKEEDSVEWKNIEYDFGIYFPKEFS